MTSPDNSIPFLYYLRPLPKGYLRLLLGSHRHTWFHTEMHLQHEIVQNNGILKSVLPKGLKL